MRKIASLFLAVQLLAGCGAYGYDKFGNEVPPPGFVPRDFTYQPFKRYPTESLETLYAWCSKNKGIYSTDHRSCVNVPFGWTKDTDPCTFVYVQNTPADRLQSQIRFARDVCNAWMPGEWARDVNPRPPIP